MKKNIYIIAIIIFLSILSLFLYYYNNYNNYNYYKKHISPFENIEISNIEGKKIRFLGASFLETGKLITEIDNINKKIYFKYIENENQLEQILILDSGNYVGYKFYYKNNYGEYHYGVVE